MAGVGFAQQLAGSVACLATGDCLQQQLPANFFLREHRHCEPGLMAQSCLPACVVEFKPTSGKPIDETANHTINKPCKATAPARRQLCRKVRGEERRTRIGKLHSRGPSIRRTPREANFSKGSMKVAPTHLFAKFSVDRTRRACPALRSLVGLLLATNRYADHSAAEDESVIDVALKRELGAALYANLDHFHHQN